MQQLNCKSSHPWYRQILLCLLRCYCYEIW